MNLTLTTYLQILTDTYRYLQILTDTLDYFVGYHSPLISTHFAYEFVKKLNE